MIYRKTTEHDLLKWPDFILCIAIRMHLTLVTIKNYVQDIVFGS